MTPSRTEAMQPVTILEIETTAALPVITQTGPGRLLVRVDGRPIAFEAVEIPETGWDEDDLREVVDRIVAEAENLIAPAPVPLTPSSDLPTVTVVITAIAATDDLARLLKELKTQTVLPDATVVVDNRPETSGIREMLNSPTFSHVRLVEEPRRGLAYARNAGLQAAETDIVAYTDDDAVPDQRWVETIKRRFTDPDVACVTGLVLPSELATPAQLLLEEFGGYSKGYRDTVFRLEDREDRGPLYPYAAGVFGTGANSSFRTSVLREIGAFETALGTGTMARGGEDLDIHLQVVTSGHALAYEPAAIIWHRHHRTMPQLRRTMFAYGVGLSAMLTKRVLSSPSDAAAISRRVGTGLRHLLAQDSTKNQNKSRGYPAHLTMLELAGFGWGPFAFICSSTMRGLRRLRGQG